MALSFREDWQLRGIERRLRKSEPGMAAELADFARLNAGTAVNGSAETCSAGSWARRWLGQVARTWMIGTAVSEGWLDPARSVGLRRSWP